MLFRGVEYDVVVAENGDMQFETAAIRGSERNRTFLSYKLLFSRWGSFTDDLSK